MLKYCNSTLCSFSAACSDSYNGKHLLQTTIIVISQLMGYIFSVLSVLRVVVHYPCPQAALHVEAATVHRVMICRLFDIVNFRISFWRNYEQIQWKHMIMAVLMMRMLGLQNPPPWHLSFYLHQRNSKCRNPDWCLAFPYLHTVRSNCACKICSRCGTCSRGV